MNRTNRLPEDALSDKHASDVCALFFMQGVGFDTDRCFGNKPDYYRALETVRVNLDVIKPQLPVIIALSAKRGFENADEMFALINVLAKYSESDMPLILNMVNDRGSFDAETVDAALGLGTNAILAGVL